MHSLIVAPLHEYGLSNVPDHIAVAYLIYAFSRTDDDPVFIFGNTITKSYKCDYDACIDFVEANHAWVYELFRIVPHIADSRVVLNKVTVQHDFIRLSFSVTT